MINKKAIIACIAGSIIFSGCASLPDATLQYYLPKSEVSLGAITTIKCNKSEKITSVTSPLIIEKSMTDYEQPRFLNLSNLNGAFNSSNISFDWYEDGRLKGINSTLTGAGTGIVEGAVKFYSTITGPGLVSDFTPASTCDLIKAEETKTISFEYKSQQKLVPPHKSSTAHNLVLTADGRSRREQFKLSSNEVPDIISGETQVSAFSMVKLNNSADNDVFKTGVPIVLRMPDRMTLKLINMGSEGVVPETAKTIAGTKEAFVFIPKPTFFGKKTFGLALNGNGSIANIQYGNENGAPQAFSSMNSLVSALGGSSVTDQVAKFKAKGDLIEQQRRLLCLESGETNC